MKPLELLLGVSILRKINGRGKKRVKYINEISEHEFWVWWGLLIVARQFGRKGDI